MYKVYVTSHGMTQGQAIVDYMASAEISAPNAWMGKLSVREQHNGGVSYTTTIELEYEVGAPHPHDDHHQTVIDAIETALQSVGNKAIEALVVKMVDYTVHGVLGGLALGAGYAISSKRKAASVAASVIATAVLSLVGGVIGAQAKKEQVVLRYTKNAWGQWNVEHPVQTLPTGA